MDLNNFYMLLHPDLHDGVVQVLFQAAGGRNGAPGDVAARLGQQQLDIT